MNGADPVDIWEEVLAWLRVADADHRAVLVCMAADPPINGVAAYHCQQAIEKLLKGFLVRASLDFGKTHDLDRLGRLVAIHYPETTTIVIEAAPWTAWSVAYRYPGLDDPEPEPTDEELLASLQVIRQLAEMLRAHEPSQRSTASDPEEEG